jgi:hypothetical protein
LIDVFCVSKEEKIIWKQVFEFKNGSCGPNESNLMLGRTFRWGNLVVLA